METPSPGQKNNKLVNNEITDWCYSVNKGALSSINTKMYIYTGLDLANVWAC